MSFFENFKKCPPTLWVLLGICSIKKVTAPPVTFHFVQSQRLLGKLILSYPFLERRCEENSVGLCDNEERFAAILLSLNSLDIPIHFKVSSVSILIWNILVLYTSVSLLVVDTHYFHFDILACVRQQASLSCLAIPFLCL